MADYSIYKYYKGDLAALKGKAAFFGSYEELFDSTYNGKPKDKEDAFKNYMYNILSEKASDMAGMSNITHNDIMASYDEMLRTYFDLEYKKELYNKK